MIQLICLLFAAVITERCTGGEIALLQSHYCTLRQEEAGAMNKSQAMLKDAD